MTTTYDPFAVPPDGLVGELAKFIHWSSNRPVREVALSASIAFLAGICGRAFNVNGTGLNQYVLFVAKTGRGKEGARQGLDRFVAAAKAAPWQHSEVKDNQLLALDRYLGPAEIASGQALIKHFGTQNSFASIMGEFGHTIERMCHPRASSSDLMLRKVLLDVFMLSGQGRVLAPMIYSNKQDDTKSVAAPALTLYGETSPTALYPHLDERMIGLGLLPRFLPIIYDGERPPSNPDALSAVIGPATLTQFADLLADVYMLNQSDKARPVGILPEAYAFIGPQGYVDTLADTIINDGAHDGVVAEMWNRAHLKTLRLAALFAVGRNHRFPAITLADAEHAFAIVRHGIDALCAKFAAGEMGDTTKADDVKLNLVRKAMREWIERSWDDLKRYGVGDADLHRMNIVPHSWFTKKLPGVAEFRNGGGTKAIQNAINELVSAGEIEKLTAGELHDGRMRSPKSSFYAMGDESTIRKEVSPDTLSFRNGFRAAAKTGRG